MKRIRGFSLAKTAESLHKNGKRALCLWRSGSTFNFEISANIYLTFILFMITFYIVRGCPGFDGIGKSCTAGRGEGPLNWRTNNCNFRKKRGRSWRGFFRSRSTRCV